jgi:hypothetical protein
MKIVLLFEIKALCLPESCLQKINVVLLSSLSDMLCQTGKENITESKASIES